MALIRCTKCDREFSDLLDYCPFCGQAVAGMNIRRTPASSPTPTRDPDEEDGFYDDSEFEFED